MSVKSFLSKLNPIRRPDDKGVLVESGWPGGPVYVKPSPDALNSATPPVLPSVAYNPAHDIGHVAAAPATTVPQQNPTPRTLAPVYNPAAPGAQPTEPATMADKYMATATPVDELTRDRRVTPPPVTLPLNVTYGPQGQPRGVEGGDSELERQQAYLDALEAYKPENHNSRGKSALIGAGRGYLQGGLPGAIVGGIAHLIKPNLDEKYQRNVDIAGQKQRVGDLTAAELAKSKIASQSVEDDYKAAQADRLRNPVYQPRPVMTDTGLVNVTPNGAQPIYDPTHPGKILQKPKTDRQPKYEIRHDPATGKAEKWKVGEGDQPDTKVPGWSDPGRDLVKRNGMWVSQGGAYSGDSLQDQRKFQKEETLKKDNERNQDQEQARIDKAEAQKQHQGQLSGKIQGSIQQMGMTKWQIEQLQAKMKALDPKREDYQRQHDYYETEIAKQQGELAKVQADGAAAAKELSTAYPDLYEAGVGQDGYPYIKMRPWSKSQWKKAYPAGTPQQLEAAAQNAKNRGQEIVE